MQALNKIIASKTDLHTAYFNVYCRCSGCKMTCDLAETKNVNTLSQLNTASEIHVTLIIQILSSSQSLSFV